MLRGNSATVLSRASCGILLLDMRRMSIIKERVSAIVDNESNGIFI